jgi:nucleotide-binding universal stress UspA family protein
MTRKLLVVFDGPHVTPMALKAAVDTFNDGALCLTLLAVVPAPSLSAQQVVPAERLRNDAITAADRWVRTGLNKLPTCVEARHRIAVGNVPDVVRSVLAETPHDAVVLCPRKRGRLRSRFLADAISRLSQSCGVPLVCVPPAD